MYPSKYDKLVALLAKIQGDAMTMTSIGRAGCDYAFLCLDMLLSAISAAENMCHCLTLECRKDADNYLPPDSPLFDIS